MSQAVFQTTRLIARRLDRGDVDAMLAVYGDPDVVRYVGDGTPLDRRGCERWVEVTLRNYATRGYGMFALVERATGAIVGFCGLVHPSGQAEPEIKYALHRGHWGRGFATEAARALLDHASHLGLGEVIATLHPGNEASARVLAKAGMLDLGLRRETEGPGTRFFRRIPVPDG
ncbi:GNAT family N-acetyltransferase [Pseudoxanthomonas suwonensis]|uniref:GNAT family N-acetyltransferase n=1 Tax=Pseudoxanthomonas suwonensis TaxID=314722 RepID=UPI0004B18A3C|nr:GNAT family N-acetyltransferase [Pseudoxanthomonas suwonensis]